MQTIHFALQATASEGVSGMGTDSLQKAIISALRDAVRMGLIKLSDFDSDGDGALDMLTVTHR
jgi:hypothetical protein